VAVWVGDFPKNSRWFVLKKKVGANDLPEPALPLPPFLNPGTGLCSNEIAMQFDFVAFFHFLSLMFLAPDARWASVAP
jgi:hypothetical protein